MIDEEKEFGSFIPEEQESKKQKSPPPTDANSVLFMIMREIRDALKENTEALNSLLTTIVGQTRNTFEDSQGKANVTTSIVPQPPIQESEGNTPLPEPTLVEKPESFSKDKIGQVKMLFPEDLENLLTFTDEGDYIKVKPRQFLGSDNFAKIAAVVRAANGEYKSAGKESHFRVPKK